MTTAKWVCRYIFLGLLLVGCIFWCVYCAVSISQMEATVNSMEFIDMALEQPTESLELLERIEKFENLLHTGLIVTAVVAGCLIALIIFQVISAKISAKKVSKPAKPQPVPVQTTPEEMPVPSTNSAATPTVPAKQGGFCTNCGVHYDELPPFCIHCGTKLKQ